MMTLEELIDTVLATDEWRSIQIMRTDYGSAFTSVRRRMHAGQYTDGYISDQITDPEVPPSVRLRTILEQCLKTREPDEDSGPAALPETNLFEDLLG